jgi:hypothetical protein
MIVTITEKMTGCRLVMAAQGKPATASPDSLWQHPSVIRRSPLFPGPEAGTLGPAPFSFLVSYRLLAISFLLALAALFGTPLFTDP